MSSTPQPLGETSTEFLTCLNIDGILEILYKLMSLFFFLVIFLCENINKLLVSVGFNLFVKWGWYPN